MCVQQALEGEWEEFLQAWSIDCQHILTSCIYLYKAVGISMASNRLALAIPLFVAIYFFEGGLHETIEYRP